MKIKVYKTTLYLLFYMMRTNLQSHELTLDMQNSKPYQALEGPCNSNRDKPE